MISEVEQLKTASNAKKTFLTVGDISVVADVEAKQSMHGQGRDHLVALGAGASYVIAINTLSCCSWRGDYLLESILTNIRFGSTSVCWPRFPQRVRPRQYPSVRQRGTKWSAKPSSLDAAVIEV